MTRSGVRFRIILLSALLIVINVCGNFSLSVGVKGLSAGSVFFVILGVALLISALLLRLTLLSATDMSLVLPVTAGTAYILTSLAGEFGLKESVRSINNVGLGMIVAGVVLIGLSARPRGLPGGRL